MTTLGFELKVSEAMNNFRLWLTRKTTCHELKAFDVINH